MHRLDLQALEQRRLLAAFVVDTATDDAGDGDGSSDGSLSLREAIIAANTNAPFGDASAGDGEGDSITFAAGLAGQTITLGNGELTIIDDLSIVNDGGDRITIDAGGNSRIFNVNTDGEVNFQGLRLINGSTDGDGGAISLAGTGDTNMTSVVIEDNRAGGAAGGGGIYNADHFVTITDSQFLNNTADGAAGSGGAMFSAEGDVDVINSDVVGNVANRAGGGFEVVVGGLFIDRSRITDNVAGPEGGAAPGNGGGVHVTGAEADVTVNLSDVARNIAALEGGGLWNSASGVMTVNSSKVFDNVASGDAADDGGGGIFNNGGDMDIFLSDIFGNVADGTAGSGGGIFSVGGGITIEASKVRDNTANRAGGGIELIDGDVIFEMGELDGNDAGFIGAASPGNGGGLHIGGDAIVLVDSSKVRLNLAANEGGGLWNSATGNLVVNFTEVSGNGASDDEAGPGGEGGGVFNNGGTLLVVDSRVLNNDAGALAGEADGDGGGVYNAAGGDAEIENTLVANNVARGGDGGGLFNAGELAFRDSVVRNNTAGGSGGGLFNDGGANFDQDNSFFLDNDPDDIA